MFISNCLHRYPIIQVNTRLAEESILRNQKYIYKATKICDLKNIYKYQRILLSTKESLLIAVNKIINVIKKKYIYPGFIIKSF